jgi:hypothetical protein
MEAKINVYRNKNTGELSLKAEENMDPAHQGFPYDTEKTMELVGTFTAEFEEAQQPEPPAPA